MNYEIGQQIKKLREERDITQDSMRALLEMSRQRYARIEKGQVDITYEMIVRIADHFGVSTKVITNVSEEKPLTVRFRESHNDEEALKEVEKIEEILKVFYYHGKLYDQMKERDKNDV